MLGRSAPVRVIDVIALLPLSDRNRLPGWCDYLVTDPMSSPQDLCAPELWRKKRLGPIAVDDQLLDLGADSDPEEPSEEWML